MLTDKKKNIVFQIGGLFFNCVTSHEKLFFNVVNSIKYLVNPESKQNCTYLLDYSLIDSEREIVNPRYQKVFKGDTAQYENVLQDSSLSYVWTIWRDEKNYLLTVDFNDHSEISSIRALFNLNSSKIDIEICPLAVKNSNFDSIDPLIHPFGSLLLMYLFLWQGGILIHGSAVNFKNHTFLFTGVSGIGKSTMARLWQECGADVINDDRLILKTENREVIVSNNPMSYYSQDPKEGKLSGIFLLKQEKHNYIKKLGGVKAFTRVLANCIQQFYDPEMVKNHLTLVDGIVKSVPIYEVGFLPTHDIVKDILKLYSNEVYE